MQQKRIRKLRHKFNHVQLARRFPKFAKRIRISSKGETVIDFKDQAALVELNQCIMEYYFSVRAFVTPPLQMAPAIGSRLNYLEWVKELVDEQHFNITYLYDVGTGYSGIFLFLAWRLYGWKGVGVDLDEAAIQNCRSIAETN